MEFWTSVKVILRRWYVVVPCVIATVAIGLYLVHQAKPSYKASGSVLLTGQGRAAHPATTPSTVAGVNPYANMDQTQLAYLVSENAGGSGFADVMKAAGASSIYSVVNIDGEPAMTISATADTPAAAMSSYRTLVKTLDSELNRREVAADAPANTLVGVQDWNSPSKALPQNAAKVKALIVVVTVGVLVTLALTFLVDSLLTGGAPWSRTGDEDEDDADEGSEVDKPLSRPVAVPAHLDLDDADLLSINDDEVDATARTRWAARYDFATPASVDRSSTSIAAADAARRGSLPPWSPPEEHPRAAGS